MAHNLLEFQRLCCSLRQVQTFSCVSSLRTVYILARPSILSCFPWLLDRGSLSRMFPHAHTLTLRCTLCVSSQAFSTLQPPQHPNDHLPRPYELSMIPARSTYDAHAHPCTLLVSYAPTNIMPILIRLSLTLRDGSTKLPYPAHYTQFLLTPPPPAARRLAACTASAARTHARSTTAWSWTAAPPPPPPPRHPRCYTSLPPLFSRAAAPPSAPAARRAAPPWRPWSAGPPRPVEGKCAPRRHNVGLKAWGLGTGFKV